MSSTCDPPTCSFSASGSNDEDGSIDAYSWNFGDGTSGSGKTISHSYAARGTDTVTLTATDNNGATDSKTQTLDLRLNPPTLDSATPTLVTCGVVLQWTPPGTGLDPDSYDIRRSTTSGAPYTTVKNVPWWETSTTDDTVGPLTTYYYVVTGAWKNANSNQKAASTSSCV